MAGPHPSREEVTELVARCTRAIVLGDWLVAHQHVVAGVWRVHRLAATDPDPRDAAVLGGLHYNGALILDRMTDDQYARVDHAIWEQPSRAWTALWYAEEAVRIYLTIDPSGGESRRVKAALRRAGSRAHEMARRIAQAADARARLARLLAEQMGPSFAEQVREHGIAALDTYGVLVRSRRAPQTTADLDRIERQVLPALRGVGVLWR